MGARPTSVSATVIDRAAALLSSDGSAVRVERVEPAAEGFSPSLSSYPWLARLVLAGWDDGRTVIVKTQRPADHWRGTDTTLREHAALDLLAELSCPVAPRLVAIDDELGLVLLEDLGRGPAVEDILVGSDRGAAVRAVLGHARALATMQAATAGQVERFYGRVGHGLTSADDRVCVQVMPFRRRWERLRAAVAATGLPAVDECAPDAVAMFDWLDQAGSLLALTNGDFMPQNSRVASSGVRLLDFEGAGFQHLLLDAVHLRVPFAAAPCWSRLPRDVADLAERTYRSALLPAFPSMADDRNYQTGVAMATAAWGVVRLTRLPDVQESGHRLEPTGWTERGQLLQLMVTAAESAAASKVLPRFRGWLEAAVATLERRWSTAGGGEPYYPAFR
ncbi:MAG TPA: hypothetical protein VFP89_06355 [Propionibacteriaceae bacterium]|nr:hypothetical protein [Propionibacteriaceae bacterium]